MSRDNVHYKIQRPTEVLAPYVEGIWVQEDLADATRQDYRPTKVLPTGSLKLILHYADPYIQLAAGRRSVEPRFYVSGQRTRAVDVAATGQTGIIIVGFHPFGAAAFFELPLHELEDAFVPLEALVQRQTLDALENRVREARTWTARTAAVQDFLVRALEPRRTDPIATEATRRINRARGNIRIQHLADDLRLSRRQLTRRFTHSIGTSPKSFARVVRVQKALAMRRRGWTWAFVAQELGYCDQAHLTKEFRSVTLQSPGPLFDIEPQSELSRYFRSGRDLTHFYDTSYL